MRKTLITSLLVVIVLISSSFGQKNKMFPAFAYKSLMGELITNENLKGTNKVIVHLHLGCPAAMFLLRELQNMKFDSSQHSRIVYILENTNGQIAAFNDTTNNIWSRTRIYFKMQPLSSNTVGECEKETEPRKNENGHDVIPKQCSVLGDKLKIKYSPTIFYLNDETEIVKRENGYNQKKTLRQIVRHINTD